MKSLLFSVLFCILCPWILACFEKQPLEPNLQQYLAQKKSCSDTFFPEPPCCGNSIDSESSSRIINGDVTGLKELTWAVSVRSVYVNLTDGEDYYSECGGSLINSRWVLTAANCLSYNKAKMWYLGTYVLVGERETDEYDIESRILAEHVESHPLFNLTGKAEYDLALLRLFEPVEYKDFVNPICLPLTPLKPKCYENRKAVVTGWGQTSSLPNSDSPVKLKAINTVWDAKKRKEYAATHDVNMNDTYQIWASGGLSNAYKGDSGGPLSLKLQKNNKYYLLGVASGIYSEDHRLDIELQSKYPTNYPTVFARIDLKWIADVILSYSEI